MRPSDFNHWTYWLRWEWDHWNPVALGLGVWGFVGNVWAYRGLLWYDRDYDYVFLLRLMERKLSRMATHFATHDIVQDSQKIARDCRVAAELCKRLQEGPVSDDSDRATLDALCHLMARRMLHWWD